VLELDADQIEEALTLDGNALAGVFREIFSVEMTASPAQCAGCGRVGELATLVAYTRAPGIVMRCPRCEQVVVRIVQTPTATYLDARGAAYVRFPRTAP